MYRARQVYEKYRNGDTLTDADLEFGINHFKALAHLAEESGPVFRLAANEARSTYLQLESFQTARKENNI